MDREIITIVTGPDLRFEFVNRAYEQLFGRRDYIGRPVREVFPDLADQPFFDLLDNAYATGERFVARAIPIRLQPTPAAVATERFLDFIYEPVRDAGGAVTGLFIEGYDVTEAHLSRQAVQESESRFRALALATANVVYRMSPDWREMQRLAGAGFLVDAPAPRANWEETYIPVGERPRVRAAIDRAIESRGVFEIEHQVLRKDGTIGWTFSRAVPVFDAAGEIIEWFGAASDISDRVKVDQSFTRLFNASPAPFLVLAPDAPHFTIKEVNDAYLLATHRTRADLLGRGVFDAFPDDPGDPAADGVARLRASLEQVLVTRAPNALANLRYDIATSDGAYETRWWHPVNSPVLDENGNVEAIVHNAYDITQQRRTEIALRESEARLKLALEAGRLAEVTFDPGGDITHSAAFAELLGHPSDKRLTLAEFRSQYHPDDHDRVVAERAAMVAGTATFYDIEKRIVWPDRQIRWVYGRGAVQRDEAKRATSMTAVYLDQTDRKLAEIALEKSEAQLRAVFEAAPIGLVFADASGRIIGGNAGLEEIVGKPVVLSRRTEDYRDDYVAYHADGRRVESHEYPLAQVLGNVAGRAELEAQVELPDGTLRWVRYIATPVRDENGVLLGGLVASLDIERDKRFAENLAQEVARAVAELTTAQEALRQSQKMEAMGALTGGVAHDFNNLLTPIIGGLDLLQRRGIGDERAQRLIGAALQSAERAKTLVQRLLAFARRQPLQSTSVDVGALVEGMADLVASTTGPQVKVVVELAADLLPAKADANQIEMALLNLAVNARDAMPDGGTLTIAAAAEDVEAPHRASLLPGHYVRLSVSDTGIGMDAQTLARAVEPFYSTKGVGKGTGLGLSMVHGLAGQLGGGLHIASRVGSGTCIELWLPVAGSPPPITQSALGADAAATGTALLVDDEDLVRESTAAMLGDMGFDVVEASSAGEALRLIDKGLSPTILVTDHLMPDMTGTELARIVANRLPSVQLLIISGYSEVEGLAPDIARLTKPFRRADLSSAISRLT